MSQNNEQQSGGKALGVNLGRLRSQRRLSLAALASRAGVSRTTVHEIEQGSANPRLDTLYALATALDVGLAELLDDPEERKAGWVVRAGEGPTVHGEAISAHLLGRIEVEGHIEVYDVELRPGTQQSMAHAPGVRECMVVHHGEVTVGLSVSPVELGPGDALLFDGTRPHVYGSTAPNGGRGTLLVLHERPSGT